MKKYTLTLLLTAAPLFAGTPAPVAPAPQPAPQGVSTGMYLNVGAAWEEDLDITTDFGFGTAINPKLQFDTGIRVDIGYQWAMSEHFALQFETGFIWNGVNDLRLDTAYFGTPSTSVSGNLWQIPVLANLIYNIPLNPGLNLYFGAGVGLTVSWLDLENSNSDAVAFAYQGVAGLNYAITPNIELGIAYKFLGTTSQTFSDIGSRYGYGYYSGNSSVDVGSAWNQSVLLTFLYKF